MDPDWLRWVKRLQAIAQDGLTYARDDYDLGRYEMVREVAAEMLATRSTGGPGDALELLELEFGPATPKVDVRAAVFRDEKILLVKEPDDKSWSTPGGWADVGETSAEAAVREESGYRVRARRLISAYDRDRQGHPLFPTTLTSSCSSARSWTTTRRRSWTPTGSSFSAKASCRTSRSPA
jgi:hypothetical protein